MIATNGSMQADAFLFQALVEPGDVVIVEAPTYDRTLLSLRQLGAEMLAIPLDDDGIDVSALEQALEGGAKPKLAHIIPNFHNPAGCTLSLEKRKRLVALAEQHDFVMFEDDPYVELRFEGEQLPTMLSLDDRGQGRLRLLVLEDGLPGHPRRVPGRARGADRRVRASWRPPRTSHRAWWPRRSWPSSARRGARALDRDREGRPARAPRRGLRRAGARPARRRVRGARGRLLPVGRSARGHRRRRARGARRRSAGWCS